MGSGVAWMAHVSLLVLVLVTLCMLLGGTQAAKIVAMPYPGGVSHVFIMAKVSKELASRGHEVSVSVLPRDHESGHQQVFHCSCVDLYLLFLMP